MKAASNRISDLRVSPFTGEDPAIVNHLRLVARTFSDLQQKRHIADYDNSIVWDSPRALEHVKLVEQAFAAWQAIRTEPIAQVYLVSLLVKSR